jgi:hypothetical protein
MQIKPGIRGWQVGRRVARKDGEELVGCQSACKFDPVSGGQYCRPNDKLTFCRKRMYLSVAQTVGFGPERSKTLCLSMGID